MITADAVAAQGLLARTPAPVLIIADTAIAAVWDIWRHLPTPAPLIAVVADEAAGESALSRGAAVALVATDNLVDFTDQLLMHLPRAEVTETGTHAVSSGGLIQALQARNLDLQREANEDSLTLLANRRYVDRRLTELSEQARQVGRRLAIFMADLDFFKQVNDQFGHMLGNEVLRVTADLMRGACRPSDVVARYGGEEFLVLMPDTPLEEAAVLAERIRLAIEQYPWSTVHPQLRVTISIGVAETSGSSPEASVEEADRRLYAAKQDGRNRVVAVG
jgi:diguanylate cyclase (GGDEF)-like protein